MPPRGSPARRASEVTPALGSKYGDPEGGRSSSPIVRRPVRRLIRGEHRESGWRPGWPAEPRLRGREPPLRPPGRHLYRRPRAGGTVSLRPIKEFVRALRPDHPLRLVLMGEPDEMDRGEYYVKLTIWLRLLPDAKP